MNNIIDKVGYLEALREEADFIANRFDISVLRGKKIFVTGATGQLGSALIHLLLVLNCQYGLNMYVYAGCRNSERFEALVSHVPDGARLEMVYFESDGSFSFDLGFDFCVHCAGYGDPRSFITDPVGVMQSNINGLDSLLKARLRQGFGRVLFVSSGEVYGQGSAEVLSFDEAYSGYVDSMIPRSCYQMSKRAGETLIASYFSQYNVDALVARQCHVFGPSFSSHDTRVVAEFLKSAKNGNDIVMKSAGLQVRSYLFELDAACAYVALLICGTSGEVYNVSPDYSVSIREFAEAVCKKTGVNLIFESGVDANSAGYGNITRSVLNPTKINQLGWRNVFSFERGIDVTLSSL